ncbi:MAG: glycosyltransferase family 4 protein [Candidatus Bathyarchaeia archaeon]
MSPPKNEDYFRLPVLVAKEMGLRACVYSMRTPVRTKKQESVSEVLVRRFDDPFFLLLSTVAQKPLIVHGHSFGWIPSSTAPLLIKKYVFTPHIYRLDKFNGNLTKLILTLISRANAIIVLTKFEAGWFIPYVEKEKIHIIPHPIDFHFFSNLKKDECDEIRRRFQIDNELVLTVANLVPRKNLETLLKGFKLVTQTLPKSKLIIVGSEPPTILGVVKTRKTKISYYESLKKMVTSLSLERQVIFAGYKNEYELRKFYAAADVFALPSTTEGQLLSAGEAAAAGLPLVLSSLEPLVEIYKECALFHAPTDHVSLANHIINLLTNKELAKKLSEAGKKKMREYDVSVIKPKLKALYEKCLKDM